jgi:hypothetical protein
MNPIKNLAEFHWFAEPISRLTGSVVTKDQAFVQVKSILLSAIEEFASFVDRHDIIVPEIKARYGGLEFTLTGRKVEDQDATPPKTPVLPADTVTHGQTTSEKP